MLWKDLILNDAGTQFFYNGKPVFERAFMDALKFHEPGLAPVADNTGWFHINHEGKDLYPQRYIRTFGFYEGFATVWAEDGWYHIDHLGQPCYSQRYIWCGNYQQGRCTVRDGSNSYFHLDTKGIPAYEARYRYAGDFRDGVASVMRSDGMFVHICFDGRLLHEHTFLDLGVFHKGYATARDYSGWFHIDRSGQPLYNSRYALIEPFYNGFARVLDMTGNWGIIDERGQLILHV